MSDERRLSIGSTARVHPDEIARRTFGTSRRGFDTAEVRAYLESLARELGAAYERQAELASSLAAAQERATNPVLDEATLTTALGQETAKVLRSAHDAAAELTAKAEADVARLRTHVEEECDQIRARAEQHAAQRGAQVEAAATEVRRRLQDEEVSRLESAKLEAEALMSQARAECRAMVQEAQELRARVLSDLTRRRRLLHTQIEQLRAGRERLAETINDARLTVDRVTDELFRAEDEARLAAEAAGRQVASHDLDDAGAGLSGAAAAVTGTVAPDVQRRPGPSSPVVPPAAAGTEDVSAGDDSEGDEERRQAVNELFARLRAEQAPDRSDGVTVLGRLPSSEPEATTMPADSPVRIATATAGELDGRPADAEAEADAGAAAENGASTRDPALLRRDEALGPALATLSRRLKRVLADDQNDVLDRLRAGGRLSADVVGSEDDHERRYREAAEGPLGEAARAGAGYAGGDPDGAPSVEALAGELAHAIVAPLRRRLLEQAEWPELDDEAAVADFVGSAFREWKGQRAERIAADHAHGAFWQAALAAIPRAEQLRWVVDDEGVQCPDCDDNALAGAMAAGETFPTGHVHPPAHPGCRCLLVPGPA
ncbi:MAG TPA: DivIVA domain-containing protein [Acidimicrobiales bacterium]|nr:DivIVA domain-containing protein [Acidimicrobiales bacterium]